MTCPDCGYMMTAFDAECARCKKLGKPLPRAPEPPRTKICPDCHFVCPIDSAECERCGYQPRPAAAQSSPPQNPYVQGALPQPVYIVSGDSISVPAGTHPVGLIAFLGLFCLPVGMMMNRQFIKALVVTACAIGIGIVTYGIGGVLVGVAAWIDSIMVASRLNRGETIGQWTSF